MYVKFVVICKPRTLNEDKTQLNTKKTEKNKTKQNKRTKTKTNRQTNKQKHCLAAAILLLSVKSI